METTYRGVYSDVYNALSVRTWRTSTEIMSEMLDQRADRRKTLGWLHYYFDLFYMASFPSVSLVQLALLTLVDEGWADIRHSPHHEGRFEWRGRVCQCSHGTRTSSFSLIVE